MIALCEYCGTEFYRNTSKQRFCNRKCSATAARDRDYFGGRRRFTIGLADKTCQLCHQRKTKGLSSHHVLGKGNDPQNLYLEALCTGCHQIVTDVSRRTFVTDIESWKRLIRYAWLRKTGRWGTVRVDLAVDFEPEDPDSGTIQNEEKKAA